MNKRANQGTSTLAAAILIAGTLYLLATSPWPIGGPIVICAGVVITLALAACAIAALEARQARRR